MPCMEGSSRDTHAGPTAAITRRRLLALTAGLGVAAAATACSDRGPEGPPKAGSSAPSTPIPPQPTQPVAPAPPPPAAVNVAMLCREAWRAQPPRPGGRTHTITHMTVHHTAVFLGDNRLAPERLRQHQRYHQEGHGWIDIAYHVSVDRNGNVYQLRDYHLVGDTATEYDPTGHFLLLCEGDFDQEAVSEAQFDGAAKVLAWAGRNFNISTETLKGHRDFAATSCPGANLYARMTSGELKQRVDQYMTDGGVNLQTLCGPEADTVVANIEAGQ